MPGFHKFARDMRVAPYLLCLEIAATMAATIDCCSTILSVLSCLPLCLLGAISPGFDRCVAQMKKQANKSFKTALPKYVSIPCHVGPALNNCT